jgi:hypothetical protein
MEPRISFEGADTGSYAVRENLMSLLLMFGNGLEGDIRMTGNTADAVEAARGLAIGTGNCQRVEAPASPLYRPGDECYVQAPSTLVFLCPTPTG